MADTYFSKFPIISYANNSVRNITERAVILHNKLVNPNSFYPLTIGPSDRPDIVANTVYGDAYRDWLIWLGNNMVDPYYGWYLSDDQFTSHIIDVYGSIEFAQAHIQYWRTVWPNNDTNSQRVPTAVYQNNLPPGWQKYFQPVISPNDNKILYYIQGSYDWRMSSNQLISFDVDGGPFMSGNVVQFTSGPNIVGQGQVTSCNSSVLVVEHVSGNTTPPLGVVDMFNTTVTGTVSDRQVLSVNIAPTEIVFWEPVSSYIVEEEANAYRRFISVIDAGQAMQASTLITTLLQQGNG